MATGSFAGWLSRQSVARVTVPRRLSLSGGR